MGLTKLQSALILFVFTMMLLVTLLGSSAPGAPIASNGKLSDPGGHPIFLDVSARVLPHTIELRQGQELYFIGTNLSQAKVILLRQDNELNKTFEAIDVLRTKVQAPKGYKLLSGARFQTSLHRKSGFVVINWTVSVGNERNEAIRIITWP